MKEFVKSITCTDTRSSPFRRQTLPLTSAAP